MSTKSGWPLILIALAITGAGVSYHFTTQSRFAALEQKLDQNSLALQQYQIAQETAVSAKAESLGNLGKQVDALQQSLAPLGKSSKEQTDSLADIRKQIASLEQLQRAQQDAQKKLDECAGQLEKIQHDLRSHESAPAMTVAGPASAASAPSTAVPAPASAPSTSLSSTAASSQTAAVMANTGSPAVVAPDKNVSTTPTPISTPAAASAQVNKPVVPPRAGSASVDIRPAAITVSRENAVRALPVALPVTAALSDNR